MKRLLLFLVSVSLGLQLASVLFLFVVVFPPVDDLRTLVPHIREVTTNESLSLLLGSVVDAQVAQLRNEVNANFRSVETYVKAAETNLSASVVKSAQIVEQDAQLLRGMVERTSGEIERGNKELGEIANQQKELSEEVKLTTNQSAVETQKSLERVATNQRIMSHQLESIDGKLTEIR